MFKKKSDILVQECSKKNIPFNKSLELFGKELCARISFIIKVQAKCVKPNVYVHIIPETDIFQ